MQYMFSRFRLAITRRTLSCPHIKSTVLLTAFRLIIIVEEIYFDLCRMAGLLQPLLFQSIHLHRLFPAYNGRSIPSRVGNSSNPKICSSPVRKSCIANPSPLELNANFTSSILAYSIACCNPWGNRMVGILCFNECNRVALLIYKI